MSNKVPPQIELGNGARMEVEFHRHPRARRYVLRLTREGRARVTVPRSGSQRDALVFARGQAQWLEAQAQEWRERQPQPLCDGVSLLFHGEPVRLKVTHELQGTRIAFAGQVVEVPGWPNDVRPAVERHLRALAKVELAGAVQRLAARAGAGPSRVTVRGQRSRWGSCSSTGALSLNWRLVQTPGWVADYVVLHELMHLREHNHSARFWALVAEACPEYKKAERWLTEHNELLNP